MKSMAPNLDGDGIADAPDCTKECRSIDHVADPEAGIRPSCHCHEALSDCPPRLKQGPIVVDPAGRRWHIVKPCTVNGVSA